MKRLATAVVVASVLAAGSLVETAAPAPTRDLWVGVLQNDLLVPVGSLVNGRWIFLETFDEAQREELSNAEGQLPARWLNGRALPDTWRAHLKSGAAKLIHVAGPLVHNQFNEGQRAVRTDSGLTDDNVGNQFFGAAIVGSVSVRFFREAPERDRSEVARFLSTRAKKEARAGIERYATSSAEDAKQWAGLGAKTIDGGSFSADRMVSMKQRDGSVLSYFEEFLHPAPERSVQVRATVLKPRSGGLRVVEITADPSGDNYVIFEPLAILERGGVSCWLTAVWYEDGIDYVLAQPRHTDSDCQLK